MMSVLSRPRIHHRTHFPMASHISAGRKPRQGSFGGAGAASQKSQLPSSNSTSGQPSMVYGTADYNSTSGQPSIAFGTGDLKSTSGQPSFVFGTGDFRVDDPPVSTYSHTQFPTLSNLKQAQSSTVQPVTEGRSKEQVGNDDQNKDLPLPGSVESEPPPPLVEVKGTNVSHSQVSQKDAQGKSFSWAGQSKGSVPVSEPSLSRDDFPPLGATSTGAKKKSVGNGGVGGSAEQAQNAHARFPSNPQEPRQRSEGESVASARGGESNINQNRQRGNYDGRRGGDRQGGERRIGRQGGERRDGRQDGQRRDATYEKQNSIEALGRTLARILRHQAVDLDLKVRNDGFVDVKDLLKLSMKTRSNRPVSSYTVEDIMQAVNEDNKNRFGIKEENGQLLIRASQGHTMKTVESEHLLKRIDSADEVPVCVHGTYRKYLDAIYKEGLKRMTRNHVHFATGEFGTKSVISGMRKTCEVLIHLDVGKALADGMKLYISENGVILTEGFDGVIPPAYFAGVLAFPGMRPIPPP